MIYPGTEVFITSNSSDNPAKTATDLEILKAAWQAALVGQ
jgi:hypothetical protein